MPKPQEEEPDAIKAALMQASGHAREGEKASLLRDMHKPELSTEDALTLAGVVGAVLLLCSLLRP